MGYHIGSFNIRDFNCPRNNSPSNTNGRDFGKIAEIIIRENFDVVAIQEVNDERALVRLTDILNRNRNFLREYAFSYGGDMHTQSKDPERYGFIWNTKRLRLMEFPRTDNPAYYYCAGGVNLQRPPYYARFTARGMRGGTNFELRLVNVHILDAPTVGEKMEEFNVLVKQVLPRICDHQQLSIFGEMMPVYTILLGDYNLVLSKSDKTQINISLIHTSYTGRRRTFKTVQEQATSLRLPNNQETMEECYANNFDHFTYEYDLIRKLKFSNPQRVNALEKYFSKQHNPSEKLRAYREKVSDHVPISMDIDLK